MITPFNSFVNELPVKIKNVLTSLLTYLILAQTVITMVVAEIDIPEVAEYGSVVLTGLASVILFVRRVTPVEQGERGLS